MGYLHIDNLYKNQTIRLADGEWTTVRDAMQARLNQMQAERDELRSRCDKLVAELVEARHEWGAL